MSAVDRAAEVILNNGARSIRDGSAWSSPQDDDVIREDCRDIAQALADAGLLAELTWESTGDNRLGQPTGRWVGPIEVREP